MRFSRSSFAGFYKNYGQLIKILLSPIVLAIIPLAFQTKASLCAFVAFFMGFMWITECLPLAVTALFPVVFYPLFGIMPAETVSIEYFRDSLMLFFGGLVLANAIEMTRLHERLALLVLKCFGSDPKWIMLGFMLTAGFMSLWITNTATASMMLPIMIAVVKRIISYDVTFQNSSKQIQSKILFQSTNTEDTLNTVEQNSKKNEHSAETDENIYDSTLENESAKRLRKGFLISLTYAASIGGMGSLVGTTPNIVLKGYYEQNIPEAKLDFLKYMLYALPVSIILEFLAWAWLAFLWLPKGYFISLKCKKHSDQSSRNRIDLGSTLKKNYAKLGPVRWEEVCVLTIFIMVIILWITRDLGVVPGWAYFFKEKYPSDSTPVIFALILLFVCPKENIFKGKPYKHLIDWNQLQKSCSWGVLLLVGGSLALAKGFQTSGLSDWIGDQLKTLDMNSKVATSIIVQIITQLFTEIASNASVAAIFLPIVDKMAKQLMINSTYLLLPMVVSTSMAFLFPAATPTNAIVFSTGDITVKDMVISGIVMKLLGLIVIFGSSNLWLGLVFNLDFQSTISSNATNMTLTSFR